MTTVRSSRDITENISHVELDPELFQLFGNSQVLEELADTLGNYWFDRGLQDLNSVVAQGKLISKYEHRLRILASVLRLSQVRRPMSGVPLFAV